MRLRFSVNQRTKKSRYFSGTTANSLQNQTKTTPTTPRTLKSQLHHHAKQLLVPREANQYRPHLIRRYGLVVLITLVIGLQLTRSGSDSSSVLGAKAPVMVSELLSDSNQQRVLNNLAPLKNNQKLAEAAYLKAQDMLAKQYWAHVAPDGTTPWQWFSKVGYNYASAGENLAKNFSSSAAVTSAWMASPGHRKNVLNPNYSDVGYGVAEGKLDGKATSLVVALYGQPAAVAVAGTSQALNAPSSQDFGPLTRVGVALQSLDPALLGSLALIVVAAGVALTAHFYRDMLPKKFRQSPYRYHGFAKLTGLIMLGFIVLIIGGGGQI